MNLKHSLAKIYWFIFRPKTFGVKCVIRYGDEILMIRNSYGGWKKWMFPGGGINQNEDAQDAAIREVKEEVGISLSEISKIGEYKSNKEFKRDTVFVFMGKTLDKDLKIDSKEIAEAGWFHFKNLPEISEYSKNILAMIP